MRRVIVLAALALTACGAASPAEEGDAAIAGKARAIDSDTVSLDFRLSGADAFERKQLCQGPDGCYPCGKLAQDAAARLLRSAKATIRLTGAASYGRPVAIVTVDGVDLGERMIAQGWAVPVTRYLRHDPARATRYVAAYTEAQANRRGAHDGSWIDPGKWRRGERLACERR